MELRREVLSYAQSTHALGFINDKYITSSYASFNPNHTNQYNYNSSIAIGQEILDGEKTEYLTYYPRAVFLGNKQIYPPIVDMNIANVRSAVAGSTAWTMEINNKYAYIGTLSGCDKTYLFPHIFWVSYLTGDQSSGRQHSILNNTYVPSFDPTTGNNSQYAYIKDNKIYLKDPMLPYILPSGSSETLSSFASNRIWSADIKMNDNVVGALQAAYSTTHIPIAYNKMSSNPQIVRRQGNLGDGMHIETTYSGAGWSSYYALKFFHDGVEVTSDTAITNSNLLTLHVEKQPDYIGIKPIGAYIPNNYDTFENKKYDKWERVGGITLLNLYFVKLPYSQSQRTTYCSDEYTYWVKHDNFYDGKRVYGSNPCGASFVMHNSTITMGQKLDAVAISQLGGSLSYLCDSNRGPFKIYAANNNGHTEPTLVLRPKVQLPSVNYTIGYYASNMIYGYTYAISGNRMTRDVDSIVVDYISSTSKERIKYQACTNTGLWEVQTSTNWFNYTEIDSVNSGYTYFHVCADVLEVYNEGPNKIMHAFTNRVRMPGILTVKKVSVNPPAAASFTTTIS